MRKQPAEMILCRVCKLGYEICGFVGLGIVTIRPDFFECVFFKACLGVLHFELRYSLLKLKGSLNCFFLIFMQ